MTAWPVRNSDELRRILSLPRRTWSKDQYEPLVDQVSRSFLTAEGLQHLNSVSSMPDESRADALKDYGLAGTPISLNWKQVLGLCEFAQVGGLYFGGPVGTGKTLLSLLLSTFAYEAWGLSYSVLIVDKSGRDQTLKDLGKLISFWRAPKPPRVITFGDLSQLQNAYMLCGCELCRRSEEATDWSGKRPDLIIVDECDQLSNPKSAVSRRLDRLIFNHPDIRVAEMTGTPMRHSFTNCRRQMLHALKFQAPVPADYITTTEMSEALDIKSRKAPREPGALVQFSGGNPDIEAVQKGYGKWIFETPGVVLIDEQSTDVPLKIRVLQAPPDLAIEREFMRYRSEGTTIDGWPIQDGLAAFNYETELSQGFVSIWDPRPPVAWSMARKEYLTLIRDAIKASQRSGEPLDSELAARRKLIDHPTVAAWREIEPTFKANTVCKVISTGIVEYAQRWLEEHGPALVWVPSVWAGELLSRVAGIPYYSKKGRDQNGRRIADHPPSISAVLSLHSNKRQRNLQAFNRNLYLAPQPSSKDFEQSIGRGHRQGQKREVHADLLCSAGVGAKAALALVEEASNAKNVMTLSQKVLHAEWDWSLVGQEVTQPHLLPDGPRRARWLR